MASDKFDKKKGGREQKRGTGDELEIIALILAEQPVLRKRVMEKIRVARMGMAQSSDSKKSAKDAI